METEITVRQEQHAVAFKSTAVVLKVCGVRTGKTHTGDEKKRIKTAIKSYGQVGPAKTTQTLGLVLT